MVAVWPRSSRDSSRSENPRHPKQERSVTSLHHGCLGPREQAVRGHAEHGGRPDDPAAVNNMYGGRKGWGRKRVHRYVGRMVSESLQSKPQETWTLWWYRHVTRLDGIGGNNRHIPFRDWRTTVNRPPLDRFKKKMSTPRRWVPANTKRHDFGLLSKRHLHS